MKTTLPPALAATGRLIAAIAVAGALTLAAAVPVRAANAVFDTPAASSKFGTGLTFTQPYTSDSAPVAADILLRVEGEFGATEVALQGSTASPLKYLFDTSSGQLQPNTQVQANFRLYFSDGSYLDGPSMSVTYADDRFKWQTLTGKLIVLHWYQGSQSFAQQALTIGDDGLAKAAALLGHTETRKVDFFVYASQSAFYDALGPSTRENVGGEANTQTRTLFALISPGDLGYASTVVPHELTHVVFDDVTRNPYHFPPHWLNEGIAVYNSQGYDSGDRSLVAAAATNGTLMPLAAIRGQFPTEQDRFYLAYAEAVSAVDFFMRQYGKADLDKLLTAFGTGASDDEAFGDAIGISTAAFDAAWQKNVGGKVLQSFGPQPAPTGPLPNGWTSGGLTGLTGQPTPAAATVTGLAAPTTAVTPSPSGALRSDPAPYMLLGIGVVVLVGVFGTIVWRLKSTSRAP